MPNLKKKNTEHHPLSSWNYFINQINLPIIILDVSGNFLRLNKQAEKIFQEPAESLIGKPFYSILDPFSYEKAKLMIEKTLQNGSLSEWELDHIQPDSIPILLGYNTIVLKDEKGEVFGIGAIGIDQTNKLKLTDHLAQTNQQLEGALLKLEKTLKELKETQAQLVQSEKMRSLGTLVAGIAHEINNPAAFVMNNLSTLNALIPDLEEMIQTYQVMKQNINEENIALIEKKESELGLEFIFDDLKDIALESLEGMDRIRKIVLSLRTFSHLDEAEFKKIDITDGLRSTIQLVRPLCKNRIELVQNFQSIPPIHCRPGELNQVFLNLLTNAIQAIENEGRIYVSTSLENNLVVVKIRDNGEGMDEDTFKRLGEPFFTTKPVGSGTGLGLSISYGIIERHRGTIEFESKVGCGTSATVKLPIL